MKVFTYSEARNNLARLLELAKTETVEIRRKNGETFILSVKSATETSPFDLPGIDAKATTGDILDAVRDSRERGA